MSLTLVNRSLNQVLSREDVRAQLRVTVDDDDALLDALCVAVTERGELSTGRAFLTQTWDYVLDAFPRDSWIELPKPPLQSVTYVRYVDMQGVTQTLDASNYLVQAPQGERSQRGRIALPFSGIWPIAIPQMGAVTIRFVCGYGKPEDVPQLLVAAMKMDAGTLYEGREGVLFGGKGAAPDELPMGVRDIYRAYRTRSTQRVAA